MDVRYAQRAFMNVQTTTVKATRSRTPFWLAIAAILSFVLMIGVPAFAQHGDSGFQFRVPAKKKPQELVPKETTPKEQPKTLDGTGLRTREHVPPTSTTPITIKQKEGAGDNLKSKGPKVFGEQIDPSALQIKYRFYTAYPKAGERLRQKRHWVSGIKWWAGRINKKCKGTLRIANVSPLAPPDKRVALNWTRKELKDQFGITIQGLKKGKISKKQGIIRYATDPRWVQGARWEWLVGKRALAKRIAKGGSNRVFHIGLFDDVYANVGQTGYIPGIVYGNYGAMQYNAAGQGRSARIHEMGHYYGLEDGDGGVMTKRMKKGNKGYGSLNYWGDDWCDKIKAHLLK